MEKVNINEILEEKKRGQALSKEEINFIIYGYKNAKITGAKMIEFMKLIDETNFSYEETFYLAEAIAETGEKLNINKEIGFVVDKHSAGSISDPTTLIFMSVLATLGVKNVKVLSGSYGDFGSSLARFNFFENFNADISKEELVEIINQHGFGVIEDKGQIAPVDKKLYDLRKKANIYSVPLVAASILSKKIATGVNAVVYDVKTGEGAIYPEESFAVNLADYLVNASKLAGILPVCVITNLDQPLGSSMGPRAELEETIAVLRSERSLYDSKLLDVAKELVVVALCLIDKAKGRSDAGKMFDEAILSGRALDNFKALIKRYGGDYQDYKHSSQNLLDGVIISYLSAQNDGYINDVSLPNLVEAYKNFSVKNNQLTDKNAGLTLLVREGQKIKVGDKIMRIFYSVNNKEYSKSITKLKDSVVINKNKPKFKKTLYKVVL